MPYVRTILDDSHPILHKPSKKVSKDEIADPLFQQLIDDMVMTAQAADGAGLAAPQIGISKRVFVMTDSSDNPFVAINPVITEMHEEVEVEEGCLSVPGKVGRIIRNRVCTVQHLDRHGKKVTSTFEDFWAQCIQHEVDHLDGIIYTEKAISVSNRQPAEASA